MNTCVVLDFTIWEHRGRKNAQAIADPLRAFGPVRMVRGDPDHPLDCQEADLLNSWVANARVSSNSGDAILCRRGPICLAS